MHEFIHNANSHMYVSVAMPKIYFIYLILMLLFLFTLHRILLAKVASNRALLMFRYHMVINNHRHFKFSCLENYGPHSSSS